VTVQVLYRAALPGILTGVLLGLARITGRDGAAAVHCAEQQFWSADLNGPTASVPVVIFPVRDEPYMPAFTGLGRRIRRHDWWCWCSAWGRAPTC